MHDNPAHFRKLLGLWMTSTGSFFSRMLSSLIPRKCHVVNIFREIHETLNMSYSFLLVCLSFHFSCFVLQLSDPNTISVMKEYMSERINKIRQQKRNKGNLSNIKNASSSLTGSFRSTMLPLNDVE